MLRWLLPIFTVFALLGQTVTSYAAAGVFGESSCCCPQPAKCKCHDHDGKSREAPSMKRCGGEAKTFAPATQIAVPAIERLAFDEPRAIAMPIVRPELLPDDVVIEIETPPF